LSNFTTQNKDKGAPMTIGIVILIGIMLVWPTGMLLRIMGSIIGTPLEWLGVNATMLLVAATSALLYLQLAYSYRSSLSSFRDCVTIGTLGIIMVLLMTWAINGLNSMAEVAAIIYLCTLGAAMIEQSKLPFFQANKSLLV